MSTQEARQAEADARYQEGIAWRNYLRLEDKEWRQDTRREDKTWREELRREDIAWREQVRAEDLEFRVRNERISKRNCALSAATQSAQPGMPPEEIFALAMKYEEWLNG